MSVFDVEVKAFLPVAEFKVLAMVARKNHTTVAALVTELVHRSLRPGGAPATAPPKKRPPVTPDTLRGFTKFYGMKYSDRAIGVELGMSAEWVRQHRRRMGLPPVGKTGRPSCLEHELMTPKADEAA